MFVDLIFNEVTQEYEASYPSIGAPVTFSTSLGGSLFGDGTSGAPSIAFTTEPTLGLYRSTAGVATLTGFLVANRFTLAAASQFIIWPAQLILGSVADGNFAVTNSAQSSFSSMDFGPSGGALTSRRLQKKVTGLADTVATAVLTVTVPNANHAAAIRLMFLSSNGSTDAFESSRAASGMVVIARTAGVDTVATAIALTDAGIATVGGGATHTLAYAVTAMVGAASVDQTFTITVAIDDTGNLGASQVLVIAETLNSNATGVTIA